MFVIVLTGTGAEVFTPPRAVGPFENWDEAQKMQQRLIDQWEAEQTQDVPAATVVRIEEPLPGVVVGEL